MNATQFQQLIQQQPALIDFLQHWESLDAEKSFSEMLNIWKQVHGGVRNFLLYHKDMTESVLGQYNVRGCKWLK